jgi:hypothetical protein
MQRNNNHIIVIGIVLILLMLTYNMAMASGCTQEETGIWACIWTWLSMQNNSAGMQAVAGITQAVAAVITFFIMWQLGTTQNNISRQQMVISRIDKRYEFYRNLMDVITRGREDHPQYWSLKSDGYSVVVADYINSVSNILYVELEQLRKKIPFFFFSDESSSELTSLLETMLNDLVKIKKLHLEMLAEIDDSGHSNLSSLDDKINKAKKDATATYNKIDEVIQSEISLKNFK